LSKRHKEKKSVQVYTRALLPLECAVSDGDPFRIHYDVRFTCARTGREYCYRHQHSDACCRPLTPDIFRENDEVAAVYMMGLPKCPYCQVRLPHDLKSMHLSECIKKYIKGHKARKEVERQSIFVQDKDIAFPSMSAPAAAAQPRRKERVAKFEEEPE
jgi:hypothetical protein